MIKKMDNGALLVTLGEGTVFTGNVYVDDTKVSSGICFTNNKNQNQIGEGDLILQIRDEKAVASYLMALTRVVETWSDESNFKNIINNLQYELNHYMPEEKK